VPRPSDVIGLTPKPIELARLRAELIFSSPMKAPPHMKRWCDLQKFFLRVLAPALWRNRMHTIRPAPTAA
jgi:hypothetical protein